jgi:tetratricopeptide (TPR) repeat protein
LCEVLDPTAANGRPEPAPAQDEVRIVLGPMSDRDVSDLLDALVPLRASLRSRVVELAGGNPDLAVQIVGDRIENDGLVVIDGVYDLRAGERLLLPPPLSRAWSDRIGRVMASLGAHERTALVAGALLGADGLRWRWSALCAAAGVAEPEIRERIATLVNFEVAGPQFVHPAIPLLLREAWSDLAAAETALAAIEEWSVPPAVLGPLLLRAGRMEEARGPMLAAAAEAWRTGDPDRAMELLDARGDIARALGKAPTGRELVQDELLRARIAWARGKGVVAAANAAVEAAERDGLTADLAEARLLLGQAFAERGDPTSAHAELQRADELFRAAGDPVGAARALTRSGDLARSEGDLDAAVQRYRQAGAAIGTGGDPSVRAAIRLGMALVTLSRGRVNEAETELLSALHSARAAGAREAEADLLCALGDAARLGNRAAAADARYRAALSEAPYQDMRRVRAIGLRRVYLRLATGRHSEAAGQLDALLAGPRGEVAGPFEAGCALARLVLAVRRDDRSWTAALESAQVALLQLRDADAAWLLELAGRRACDAGRSERAEVVWRLAAANYRALGRHADGARIDRAAETLPRARIGR